ncbi:ATP-dependent 3'-5' DNA helicase KNAG_0M01490 [Huiozyma naganishii CBS 8797]|uniref:RNA helicase n=1 Tax=Huiozyma naganishii (strain ATCC MYA-139 / BCRC 22969 / CBS 8797 / KCTC 17520 / NBRC 10181 / NCYC 3082 / Yp74L-3) TaxID=1071383 RepID=J7S463_HUIN7|nr:hypothetical protein KNAG_0M01490 [Kazachstania naganishii CBS 8797]CCK73002.1 hypothetical protein KNAG_0M01490 [Kazachstania naganishii CBS 8797]
MSSDDFRVTKRLKRETNGKLGEVKDLFSRLNTLYTFLMCRKHVVPTFKTLTTPLVSVIGRPITKLDLARIVAIMPRDCEFKYIDENQIITETKRFDFKNGGYQQRENDIFELKNVEDQFKGQLSTQLLLFEFVDGNMQRSWTRSNSDEYNNSHKVKLPAYTTDEMKKMILKRSERFENNLQKFCSACESRGCDSFDELTKVAAKYVPEEKSYEDPIEALTKARANKNTDDDEQRDTVSVDEETGLERPSIKSMIEKFKKLDSYYDQIKDHFIIPARSAKYGELDFDLSPTIFNAIEHQQFYTHQADALNAVHKGENVIITTSTSSGKSLIYQVSAIDILLQDPEATFMYIFPTKALAQDQKRSFEAIISKIPQLKGISVNTYDGDTEQADRREIRRNARVIFTNPDMIHASILPNHTNWKHFLYNLKIVVVDELHIYRGLFGSNVALVMRRLLRICQVHYQNHELHFISCSATLRHPVEHMKDIFGVEQVKLIQQDGSPNGPKNLVIWNPPILGQHMRKRENFIGESAKILVELILQNVRTIAFCFVRRVCELLMKEVRSIFVEMNRTDLLTDVMSYRGGYSPADRRKIEREMFHGNLKAVISTNALELGIDIGGLDAVLMCGFPLSLANFHQQSGRAGRRNNDSLTLVVATDSPVDQHYVAHPEALLDADNTDSYQELILDFTNPLVLEGHIQCAAFELPIVIERDKQYFEEESLAKICETKLLHNDEGYHASNKFLPWPSKLISLRGGDEDMFAVVDITNNRNIVIEQVETKRTSFTLYDGGIFIHQGYPYLVKEVNPDDKYATVQRVDVDWVTQQRDYTDVDPQLIEIVRSLPDSDVPVYFGKMRTTIVVFGFFKMDKYKRIIDAVETHNDPIVFYSKGLWIDIPPRALELCEQKQLSIAGAIHASQHAIMGILPRFIVAGVDEIVTECKAPEKEFAERQTKRKRPGRLVFYDSKGGEHGSGLSIKVFEHMDEIISTALKRIEDCPCDDGCPNCVAGAYCTENCLVLSKPGALLLLHYILGHDESKFLDTIKDGPEPNMPEIKVETVVPVLDHVKFSGNFKIADNLS